MSYRHTQRLFAPKIRLRTISKAAERYLEQYGDRW